MTLLTLASQTGITPNRISSSRGGEYHSPCPACGGADRFIIRPEEGRYWCRQCKRCGDAIQFCRDFLSMSFREAQAATGCESIQGQRSYRQTEWKEARKPVGLWMQKAEEFIESAHHRLLADAEVLGWIMPSRGLSRETIRDRRLGWNPINSFPLRIDWGLEETDKKKLRLPRGIVIPTYDVLGSGLPSRIKMRRADWKEGDKWPKYDQVPGSSDIPAIYGFTTCKTAMLLESELDAMKVAQDTKGFCTCVALGGAGKRPDARMAEWLRGRDLILYSLDFDEAGDNEYCWWKSSFPQLGRWRANSHKSPADSAILGGVDLWEWFLSGVEFWKIK